MGYKIWSLAPHTALASGFDDPRALNYKTGLISSLFAKLSFIKGELLSVKYYKDFDGKEYSDLILDVSVTYNRNDGGVLTDRITTRRWTIDGKDEQFGDYVKTTQKFYTITQAAVADQRRRSNIVDNLVAKADSGVVTYVKTMFRNLDNEINSYKSTGDTSIIEKIGNYNGAWLDAIAIPKAVAGNDVTLRQVIIQQLSI